MRAFLAVEFPASVLASLAELTAALKAEAVQAKWVTPDQMHVTLKFFEDLSDAQRQSVDKAVENACMETPPFPLAVRGSGGFGSGEALRVIWAGVEDEAGKLASFAERLAASLEKIGFSREDRPFRPHVTLCRFRQPNRSAELKARLESLKRFDGGSFQVSEAALFSSMLRQSGPVYTRLQRYPLRTGL